MAIADDTETISVSSNNPPTSIGWEQRYSDDSGVQFAVRLSGGVIEIESEGDELTMPIEQLEWLIDCLSAGQVMTHPLREKQ